MATTQAFRNISPKTNRPFYRLAYSYTKNSDAALDVVQDAIVKGIEKLHYAPQSRIYENVVLSDFGQ